jgi:hypothetical protein
MVAQTEREIYGDPADGPDQADQSSPNASSLDDDAWWDRFWPAEDGSTKRREQPIGGPLLNTSSNDDDPNTDSPPTDRPKPWWEDHPDIKAIVARTEREIYGRPERPEIDYPDPVLYDILSGNSIRELRNARDDLKRAKTRYDDAVRAGRNACLSWAQIGGILGVSRQQLHRRYRNVTDC